MPAGKVYHQVLQFALPKVVADVLGAGLIVSPNGSDLLALATTASSKIFCGVVKAAGNGDAKVVVAFGENTIQSIIVTDTKTVDLYDNLVIGATAGRIQKQDGGTPEADNKVLGLCLGTITMLGDGSSKYVVADSSVTGNTAGTKTALVLFKGWRTA